MIWSIFADTYPGSPASQMPLKAFDALDREIG
jgi:hypothetical protein